MNANARRVRRHYLPRDRFWQRLLPDASVRVTRNLVELRAALSSFEAQGVDIVACLGGDGTLNCVVSAILQRWDGRNAPAVLPLAGGTLNGLARAYATAGAPARTLAAALDAASTGQLRVRPWRVVSVRAASARDPLFGFTFAAGLPARAAKLYYRRADPGKLDLFRVSALPLTASIFGGSFYAPTELEVTLDGTRPLAAPHTFVAGVVENPFQWFRPFGPTPNDGSGFYFAAASLRPRDIAPHLWSIYRGRCIHPEVYVGTGKEAEIRCGEGFVMDGELVSLDELVKLRLTLGPAIRICDAATLSPRSTEQQRRL